MGGQHPIGSHILAVAFCADDRQTETVERGMKYGAKRFAAKAASLAVGEQSNSDLHAPVIIEIVEQYFAHQFSVRTDCPVDRRFGLEVLARFREEIFFIRIGTIRAIVVAPIAVSLIVEPIYSITLGASG